MRYERDYKSFTVIDHFIIYFGGVFQVIHFERWKNSIHIKRSIFLTMWVIFFIGISIIFNSVVFMRSHWKIFLFLSDLFISHQCCGDFAAMKLWNYFWNRQNDNSIQSGFSHSQKIEFVFPQVYEILHKLRFRIPCSTFFVDLVEKKIFFRVSIEIVSNHSWFGWQRLNLQLKRFSNIFSVPKSTVPFENVENINDQRLPKEKCILPLHRAWRWKRFSRMPRTMQLTGSIALFPLFYLRSGISKEIQDSLSNILNICLSISEIMFLPPSAPYPRFIWNSTDNCKSNSKFLPLSLNLQTPQELLLKSNIWKNAICVS